jgi:hypothetical protein
MMLGFHVFSDDYLHNLIVKDAEGFLNSALNWWSVDRLVRIISFNGDFSN